MRRILATHRAAEPLGPGPPGGASAMIAGTASGLPSWLRTVLIFQLALSFARGHYYSPTMAHYLFNFSGHRDAAATLLRAKMWGIGSDERHRDALAPGDLILIYLAPPDRAFVGRAELASAARVWMPSEDYPGDSPSGVLLSHVEEWDPPVPMDAVVARIDPAGVNPYV